MKILGFFWLARGCVNPDTSMHYVIYFLTVPVLLLGGLLGLSATMEPAGQAKAVEPAPAIKLVPTTTAEMAARARQEALAVEAEFKRRNPPQPIEVAASVPAPSDVKAVRKTAAAGNRSRKKAERIARRDPRAVEGSFGLAAAPSLYSFRVND